MIIQCAQPRTPKNAVMSKNKGNLALRENSTRKRHSDHGLDHRFAKRKKPRGLKETQAQKVMTLVRGTSPLPCKRNV